MGIFKGLKDAKITGGGNKEREGHYIERMDKIVRSDPNDPTTPQLRTQMAAVFVEKTIVRVIDNAQGKGHSVGESVTDAFHFYPGNRDSKLANFKSMVMVLLGVSEEEAGKEAVAEQLSSLQQPLAGMLCESNTVQQMRKNVKPGENTYFTRTRYIRPYTPAEALKLLTPEEIVRFYPDNFLDKQLAALAALAAAPAPAPQPTPAPAPTPVPQVGVITKLPVGVTPPGMLPAPAGWVFATADGGKTWVFVAA